MTNPINTSSSQEVDFLELLQALWTKKVTILGVVFLSGLGSVLYSLQLIDIYRATALLSPNSAESAPQIPAQLGFAANIAGLSLGGSDNSTVNALAIIESREFAKEFIAEHDMLPLLFASEFDAATGSSVIDPEIYNVETRNWGDEGTTGPSDWEAYKKFSSILRVTQNSGSGLVTIAIEWQDPYLAARWANLLVQDINNHIKENDIQEAQAAISYLQNQLESTQLVEMQRVFYELIESQMRTLMLADIREGYMFSTIDAAVRPEEKIRPSRALICILGTMLGGILAVIFVLARYFFKKNRTT